MSSPAFFRLPTFSLHIAFFHRALGRASAFPTFILTGFLVPAFAPYFRLFFPRRLLAARLRSVSFFTSDRFAQSEEAREEGMQLFDGG